MDSIIIKELQIETIIGVLPEEKTQPQLLLIDLEITQYLSIAAKSDCLKDTIDYSAVVNAIEEFAGQHNFELLEAFAGHLLDKLMTQFQLKNIKMQLRKPNAIVNAKYAAICLSR